MTTHGMFEKSVLIVAHPDDEILWFSSVLERMDKIVICYSEIGSRPDWTAGRHQALADYPLASVTGLGLTESEAFNGARWENPVAAPYGLEVAKSDRTMPGFSATRYRDNYAELRKWLSHNLTGVRNVYTHNPWGEYGHEEHVQIYAAVKALQPAFGFSLWWSNYCSNKSAPLMLSRFARFRSRCHAIETNVKLAHQIKELYQRHGCWTWYDDYEWPEREYFIADDEPATMSVARGSGQLLPLNFIHVEAPWDQPKDSPAGSRWIRWARRIAARPSMPVPRI